MLISLNNRLHRRENGFTLIEFLIVMGILLILSALAVPFYLGAIKRAWVTSVTSDVTQSALRFNTWYTDACSGNPDCGLPTQDDWNSSIRVKSGPDNIITAYVYKPGQITSSANAETTDANDYYSQGIVCIQGLVNKITSPGDKDRLWSFYFVVGQGGNITAVKNSEVQNVSGTDVSGNIRQGGCDGATVGNPQLGDNSNYLNSNSSLVAALTGSWTVSNVYN